MKYTNGEWSVFGDPEDECPGIEADGVSIVVYGEKLADDAGVQGHTVEEAKGNANLICAAVNAARAISPANPLAAAQAMPQIVAALRAIVSVADNPGSFQRKEDIIRVIPTRLIDIARQALAALETA